LARDGRLAARKRAGEDLEDLFFFFFFFFFLRDLRDLRVIRVSLLPNPVPVP
jgi:hypothetical protein